MTTRKAQRLLRLARLRGDRLAIATLEAFLLRRMAVWR